MNLIQERKRAMYYLVKDTLIKVPEAIIATMPNFLALNETLNATVALIIQESESQTTNRLGYGILKKNLKLAMSQQAIDVASRIEAFAVQSDDVVLEKEMSQRISLLSKTKDTVAADICQFIQNKGLLLLASIETYGVTAETLVILQKSIDKYVVSIPTPKIGINERKKATIQMAALFTTSDKILKKMDTLARMLRYSNPDFYNLYFTSRKIGKPGYRTISLQGIITNTDGIPLQKAEVTIGENQIGRYTSPKGAFEVKSLETGIYSVTVTKAGYIETSVQVAVTATQRCQIAIALVADNDVIEDVA